MHQRPQMHQAEELHLELFARRDAHYRVFELAWVEIGAPERQALLALRPKGLTLAVYSGWESVNLRAQPQAYPTMQDRRETLAQRALEGAGASELRALARRNALFLNFRESPERVLDRITGGAPAGMSLPFSRIHELAAQTHARQQRLTRSSGSVRFCKTLLDRALHGAPGPRISEIAAQWASAAHPDIASPEWLATDAPDSISAPLRAFEALMGEGAWAPVPGSQANPVAQMLLGSGAQARERFEAFERQSAERQAITEDLTPPIGPAPQSRRANSL